MKTDPRKNLNDYARYSGMALQMLAIILLGVFAGYQLDKWLDIKPVMIVILSLTSVVVSIYSITKDLLHK